MPCLLETLQCVLCCEEEVSLDDDDYEALDASCCTSITTAAAGALSRLFVRRERVKTVVVNDCWNSNPRHSTIQGSSSSSSSASCPPRNYSPAKPLLFPPPLSPSSSSSFSSLVRKCSPVRLPEATPKPLLVSTTSTISSSQYKSSENAGIEKNKPDLIKKEPTKSEIPKTFNSSVAQRNLIDPSPLILVPAKHVIKSENKKSEVPRTSTSSVPNTNSRDPTPSTFSSGPAPSSLKPPPLSPSPSGPPGSENKTKYVSVQKDTSPLYVIPDDLKALIEMDIVPGVLKKDLTPSTYKDCFSALLYAEDFYIEKWSDFHLNNVTLELHRASITLESRKAATYAKSRRDKTLIENIIPKEKTFVSFEIDSVPERRPFLLSRDFVFLQPSGKTVEPFRGILYRVIGSSLVLAEFGDDFHSRHSQNSRYDVRFSFNRVCLKRSHQAIATSTCLFRKFLFPSQTSRASFLNQPFVIPPFRKRNLSMEQCSVIENISRLKNPPPYLIEGPLSVITVRNWSNTGSEIREKKLSATGAVIKEAVLQICSTSPGCRILVSAPTNSTCDTLMRSLKEEIPESDIFRANAAFRELDGVPYDILPFCPYEGECFTCPALQELQRFKVVLSTFVSSFRLRDKGICPGHFSHIFLVDASSATEPETLVVLANLADETTVVVITGAAGNQSRWVRSDIARRNGLKVSYFQRLLRSKPYNSFDPMFVAQIREEP